MIAPFALAGLSLTQAGGSVISLATIGAFIVDEGLGGPIFRAITTDFNTEFVAAAVLTTLLAVAVYALIAGTQRLLTPWARRGLAR